MRVQAGRQLAGQLAVAKFAVMIVVTDGQSWQFAVLRMEGRVLHITTTGEAAAHQGPASQPTNQPTNYLIL